MNYGPTFASSTYTTMFASIFHNEISIYLLFYSVFGFVRVGLAHDITILSIYFRSSLVHQKA